MENKLISIIVPVYNAEEYLYNCLNSIIKQSFKNLEIILVDDGSTDDSSKICDEYAKKDNRIKVIHQKNSGVSSARNSGIAAATGTYIAFVDSDDWLELNTYELAYEAMVKNKADVAIFSYFRNYQDRELTKQLFDKDIIFDKNGCISLYKSLVGPSDQQLATPQNIANISTTWGKLYRLDIIRLNVILFTDLALIGTYEDGLFNLEYFRHVSKAIYINAHLYHYRKTNENSITTKYRPSLHNQWSQLYKIIEDHLKEHSLPQPFYTALQNRIAIDLIGLGLNSIISSKSVKEKIKEIKQILSDQKYKIAISSLSLHAMPFYWKIFFLFAKLNFALGVYLLLNVMNFLKKRL